MLHKIWFVGMKAPIDCRGHGIRHHHQAARWALEGALFPTRYPHEWNAVGSKLLQAGSENDSSGFSCTTTESRGAVLHKCAQGSRSLKAAAASVELNDEYTEMLLTAGPSGRKTEMVVNQVKWTAGRAKTQRAAVKEWVCVCCVCSNV